MNIESHERTVVEYHVNMSREQAECLLALIYGHMSFLEESPLDDMYRALIRAMDLHQEGGTLGDLDQLSAKYARYIRGALATAKPT